MVLVGLALFLIDLNVTNHGLPTAGAILALVTGGLVLLSTGVPYAGVLLVAVAVVAALMGGVLFGILGSLRASKGQPAIIGKEGIIGEVGTVRSPLGAGAQGWVFVHGERWRAVLAFVSGETELAEYEPFVEVGRKVTVVGFRDEAVMEVVPAEWPSRRSILDTKD